MKVVLPSTQKSWIGWSSSYKDQFNHSPLKGKAFHIKEIIKGNYFYPKEDGSGESTFSSRPLKSGELVGLRVSNIVSVFDS